MNISVALCTWNAGQYLESQLDSILAQELPVTEVHVCDDVSSDTTHGMLDAYVQRYPGIVHAHYNERNLGGKRNFEKALRLCSGDIIFLADQDDIWETHKTRVLVAALKSDPLLLGVFSNAALIDAHGGALPGRFWESIRFSPADRQSLDPGNLIAYLLERSNVVAGSMLAIRREALERVLPFRLLDEIWHDEWIALCLAARGALGFVDAPLMAYRLHPGQQVGLGSQSHSREVLDRLDALKDPARMAADPLLRFNHAWQTFWRTRRFATEIPELLPLAETYHARALEARRELLRSLPFIQRKARLLKWALNGSFETGFAALLRD